MFGYTFLISEVWFQELEIGVKELKSIISISNCHPGFWINWPPIFQELTLKDLINITLDPDTRYHERKKDKSHHQEKKPEASKSNSSSSNQKKNNNFKNRDKHHSPLLNKDLNLMGSKKERRIKEGLCAILVGRRVLSIVSKDLKTSFPNCQESFPARENPE
ncbi:hypothetical protein O181_045373 [Austropuccinia psidii MF-1]|uniref:Uncharacterized protein n=1 Tax=Austropuccinia psidii MF-1 TaxID=1389203 RepID=A0A9Q3HHJ9_9BASI|nr:hypothetical protein [Austropuccinia psidii MF-1]